MAEIYENDLINRFPTYTIASSTTGSITTATAHDGPTLIAQGSGSTVADAFFNLRDKLVGGKEILPDSTTTQRDALAGVIEGQYIYNSTNDAVEKFSNAVWVPTNEIHVGDFNFQGNVKIGGDTSIDPLGALHVIGTDAESGRIRTVRFQNSAISSAAVQIGHSRGSGESSLSPLLSGDQIGRLLFVGDSGIVQAANGPDMIGVTTENWSNTDRGSKIQFRTIKDKETTQNVAFTISENTFPVLPTYLKASLPAVEAGGIIYVSDETGGATLAFSDGTNWRRVQDRAIVS